jgi:hypothetical protein
VVRFDDYIGQPIMLGLLASSPEGEIVHVYLVKLCGVEAGGIWVESKEMTQIFQQALIKADFPPEVQSVDFAHFVPYTRIASVEIPLIPLDPTTLGLTGDSQDS